MDSDTRRKLAITLAFIACPNCGGKLYPHDFGMTNIRCEECGFEAIFQMMEGESRELAFTIDTQDAQMLMAQKVKIPPVILHWTWHHSQLNMRMEAADLYPFIPYTFLRAADVSLSLSGQPNPTLVFLQDEKLAKIRIYNNPSEDDEIAQIVSKWDTISASKIQRMFNFGYSHASRIQDLAREIRRKAGLSDGSVDDDEEEE